MAPSFSLKTLDGKELKLADYRGKAVMLYFWATWCGPCVVSRPQLKEFYAEMKEAFGDKFEMISLSMDDYEPKLRAHVKKYNLTWPQVRIGLHSRISSDYGVNDSAPKYFLLGPDGRFLLTPESPDDSDEKAIIQKALKNISRRQDNEFAIH